MQEMARSCMARQKITTDIMRKKFKDRLEALNIEMGQLINYLSTFSEEALNKQPQSGSWSALQVTNHLVLSEKLSLAYCKKKLSFQPQLKKAGVLGSLKSALVQFYLWSPIKAKAPKGISTEVLPENDTVDSVHQKWKVVREEMARFINDLPEEYVDKEVYKHPFGGRLSIDGMMAFFQAHLERHRKQIQKALS